MSHENKDNVSVNVELNEEYDPYKYRSIKNPLSDVVAFMHIIKGMFGTGILVLPFVFRHAGWVFGFVGTILTAVFSAHCLHILIRSKHVLCKKLRIPMMTYSDSFKFALNEGPKSFKKLSKYSGYVVDGFLVIHQIGSACVYILFMAINIKGLVDTYLPPIALQMYIAFLYVPIIFSNAVRSLKAMGPLSIAANVISLVTFGGTGYYMVLNLPSLSERNCFGSISKLPLFFGTVLFSMECVGVV